MEERALVLIIMIIYAIISYVLLCLFQKIKERKEKKMLQKYAKFNLRYEELQDLVSRNIIKKVYIDLDNKKQITSFKMRNNTISKKTAVYVNGKKYTDKNSYFAGDNVNNLYVIGKKEDYIIELHSTKLFCD